MADAEERAAWNARHQRAREARKNLEQWELQHLFPSGGEHHDAWRFAQIMTLCPTPGSGRSRVPTAEEAMAGLALLATLREWLDDAEPQLVDAAREAGATWEELAELLEVGDRRAAHRRRQRQVLPWDRFPRPEDDD